MDNLSEVVVDDLNTVIADTEALLMATVDQGDEKLTRVRMKAEESIRAVKARLQEAQVTAIAKTRAAAKATDVYVHENPWKAIGAATSLGVMLGLLIGRR